MNELLKGTQVVTLALNLPGPLAAKRFTDLGATVIKVEPPEGDPFNTYCTDWYVSVNDGQQVSFIDLKSADGLEQLSALLSTAQLLITAQRPAALERLDLGWDSLHAQHPQLNHLAIVGYPEPKENHAGHDVTYQASRGLLSPPHMPKTLVADLAGAERAAFEGLSMLMASQADGQGRRSLVALSDAADYMAQPYDYGLTNHGSLLSGVLPEYCLYQAKTGWVAIAALEPHFRKALTTQLELSSLSKDSVAEKMKGKTAEEWERWANQYDIPLVAVKAELK
ncbi:MAG TPA: CoA transferase [Cycloclasticus sp.]|jgi:crotonobetainyl-CoA:carnitine CoA-transferase CaiB-like acyl-CoA transferase|nr:CoA transferase [Cycloclasticus sp.]HIL91184.1 CoA transferase [Cycloclasticus sp.]